MCASFVMLMLGLFNGLLREEFIMSMSKPFLESFVGWDFLDDIANKQEPCGSYIMYVQYV